MKQTASIISTYTADTFGVCSALYELGGMVVMHDPSGCNSTYTTHDEPRWEGASRSSGQETGASRSSEQETSRSAIYISGLTEREAVLGDDRRFIADVCAAAASQRPRFIALIASPLATMVGVDMAAIAKIVQRRSNVTTFTLPTDGMHYYTRGVSLALDWLAKAVKREKPGAGSGERVNVLGITPLDFAMTTPASLRGWLAESGFALQSMWTLECGGWDAVMAAGGADVNLVVSSGGLCAAQTLRQRFDQPYVVGVPVKGKMSAVVSDDLRSAMRDGQSRVSYLPTTSSTTATTTLVIGEAVTAQSLAANLGARAVVFNDDCRPPLRGGTLTATYESELAPLLAKSTTVVADPMYRPVVPKAARFVELPHRAFSGRLHERRMVDLIANQIGFPP